MPEAITRDETTLYACSVCGLLYTEEATASRCQAWCTQHQSCNIEIIKASVGSKENAGIV